MLKSLLAACGCLLATAATAQTDCSVPLLQVFHHGQAVPLTGSPLPASAQMRLVSAPGCPAAKRYQATGAEVTLIRNGKYVLPILLVPQSGIDLRPFQKVAQPGDYLYVFIPYKNLRVVAADGSQRPYVRPTPASGKQNTSTPPANGVSFRWEVVK